MKKVRKERLRQRLRKRGMSGSVDDGEIYRVISMLNVWPQKIRQDVECEMHGNFTIIDVSPSDWAAPAVRAWLQKHVQ